MIPWDEGNCVKGSILLLAIAAGTGCAGREANPATWAGRIDTLPGGVVRVHSPATGLWDSAGRWEVEETTRIGTDSGEGPGSFDDVRSIAVDRQGLIYVLEGSTQEIRVFDSAGTWQRTIGRKGAGPGEIKDAIGIAFDSAGRLWAVDQGAARFTVWDSAGAFRTTVRRLFSSWLVSQWDGSFLDDGRLIEPVPGPTFNDQWRLVAMDPGTGAALDTFSLPVFHQMYYQITIKGGTSRSQVPFSPGLTWTIDRHGFL